MKLVMSLQVGLILMQSMSFKMAANVEYMNS